MSEQIPVHLIEKLFDDRRTSNTVRLVWGGIKYVVSFALLFSVFFIIFNFPAYYARAQYLLNPPKTEATKTVLEPVPLGKQEVPQLSELSPGLENNRLIIPELKIDVPVVWDVSFEEIIPKLRDGIVHYGGTALPGQNGNVFITGHSSNFWWDKGKFNTIFANLNSVEEGDEIVATYENVRYRYVVEKKFVVDPSKIEVLNPTDHSIISLMTCTPVGTTINRLIIQAKQVEPLPAEALAEAGVPKTPPLPDKLPAIR